LLASWEKRENPAIPITSLRGAVVTVFCCFQPGNRALSAFDAWNAGIATTINVDPGPNILRGTSGNDLIRGSRGSGLIIGGPADDRLVRDDGADLILGNGGTNAIHGGDGINILIGGVNVDGVCGEDGVDISFAGRAAIWREARGESQNRWHSPDQRSHVEDSGPDLRSPLAVERPVCVTS
jgi:hypothetical protein